MKKLTKVSLILVFLIILGLFIPSKYCMPVEGASAADYNKSTFWYYPWGKSITHKGVDIFADSGTNVLSSTNGIVLLAGNINRGGNYILILGPKWRLHYYAHLQRIETNSFSYVDCNEIIGTVGSSGNAKGKAPHLHYSVLTLLPYPWRIDFEKQGWKKMFYLNPIDNFEN